MTVAQKERLTSDIYQQEERWHTHHELERWHFPANAIWAQHNSQIIPKRP